MSGAGSGTSLAAYYAYRMQRLNAVIEFGGLGERGGPGGVRGSMRHDSIEFVSPVNHHTASSWLFGHRSTSNPCQRLQPWQQPASPHPTPLLYPFVPGRLLVALPLYAPSKPTQTVIKGGTALSTIQLLPHCYYTVYCIVHNYTVTTTLRTNSTEWLTVLNGPLLYILC